MYSYIDKGDIKRASNVLKVVTAGSTYLDIDAYACCVALKELLLLKGESAVAYSRAKGNYSVCSFLCEKAHFTTTLPMDYRNNSVKYIIVDVSDPDYIASDIPLSEVTEIYDHHVGFEEYWKTRIVKGTHIEFIGAAATLIYREWKKAGLQDKMTRPTALLLIAAILDNTLYLTSSNTTSEDVAVFNELCEKFNVGADWCAEYFSQVQSNVEADLKNALLNDLKRNFGNDSLPPYMAQLCVWNADGIYERLHEIRRWFADMDGWMLNIIDIKRSCSCFVCDDERQQVKLASVFGVQFDKGIAVTSKPYLRKEIIKQILSKNIGG